MPFSLKTIIVYFFVFPSILYAGLITQFSFDFFAPDHLWKAYNALALSIFNGALDVSYEDIGRESFTYNGKVYFYFGYFPVLLRLLLSPFLDLNVVNLSRISVWLMTTIGAASLQYILIFYSRPNNYHLKWDFISKTKLIILSLILWFGSAFFIIAQKGDIYHEPYAAMLMLSSMFVAVVYKDIIWDYKSRKYRLCLYALLAALCVHSRLTIAVSLYLGVLILIVMKSVDTVDELRKDNQFVNVKLVLYEFFKLSYRPLFILFLGGALLLFLNYLRFDDLFTMSKGQYGYRRVGEAFSARLCGAYVTGAERFEIGRIIPNLIYYLKGGAAFHAQFINYLGLGYVRLEYKTIRFIWLYSSQLIIFICVFFQLCRSFILQRNSKSILTISIMTAFLFSSLLMLSYTTITIRYTADLWLPLGFALLIFSSSWLIESESCKKIIWYVLPISIIANIAYGTYVYTEYEKWDPSKENGLPNQKILNRLYNPVIRKGDIDEVCKKYNFRVRD